MKRAVQRMTFSGCLVVLGLQALLADEPRLIRPDGSAQSLPVDTDPVALVVTNAEGEFELNLESNAILIVATKASNQDLIHGARLLTGNITHTDAIQAGDDLVVQFPEALPLQSPEGGPFVTDDGIGEVVHFSSLWPYPTVTGKTTRKVCEPGCPPWPNDPTCCTILGCSGKYTDCIVFQY